MKVQNMKEKNACLNNLIPELDSDIIALSDANSIYPPDAIKKSVRNFYDKEVGCVCGKHCLYNPDDNIAGNGEGIYQNYETKIKKLESSFGTLISGNGSIFAFRRELHEPIPLNMPNDFFTPANIAINGKYVLFEEEYYCHKKASKKINDEYERHSRIASRGITAVLFLIGKALKERKFFIAFLLVSHRLLRWLSSIFLLVLLFSNILCQKGVFGFLLAIQACFYISALIAYVVSFFDDNSKLFYKPYYFLMMNKAGFKGPLYGHHR